ACPTDSSLEADQDRENIAKTSTLPSDSTPRVTSLAVDEGSMQQKLNELTALCTSLQRQQSEMISKFALQELEINRLKARIKLLEDKDRGAAEQPGDDAPIKGKSLDEGEEAAERVSDDTEEMATILTSMDAASILTSGGVQVVPTAAEVANATVSIPTGSGVVSTASLTIPTAALIFTTATESTPYTRRKGKETMVESETPKKNKVQEQIDVQLARELEEEMVRDTQRMNEQIARDAEIAKIHAEEELQMLIDGLDKNNETVAKYLQEYHQFATELPIERRIELISDLVKYQDNYAKVLKYRTRQRKPLTRKQQREFYTSGEGLGTPTGSHHTTTFEASQSSHHEFPSPSLPPVPTESLPTVIPSDNPPLRQYTRRSRIAQSLALSHGEACPTDSGLEADQDRAKIPKTSTLPSDSTPRVTSLATDKGTLCISLQRQQSEMVSKFKAQELEINSLKARIKLLEDKDRGVVEQSGDDALIKGRRLDEREEATKRVSNDTEEMATVLTSIDAAISIASPTIPTAALIFNTAIESTPYTRRKGKEMMVESDTLKKKKLQEQIDVQVARELEEEMARDAQRMNEQTARDAEIQRNPLSRKQQKELFMSVLKNHVGWKARHFNGMTLEEIKEKFDPVWKQWQDFIPIGSKEEAERFKRKGLRLEQENVKKIKTSEEIKETKEVTKEKVKEMMQLVSIEEIYVEALQVKHPIIDWKVHTEGQRSYWKIIRLGGSLASYHFFVDMLKHLDREDLKQLWELVKETLSIRPAISDKEMEIWVELKRLYEPDVEDQLWTHTQNLMHALVKWKLCDTCGVYHVTSKDKQIFMLVEKDYPLRKGLATVMISYKLQVENHSQMANDLILKIYKIASSLRQQDD
nr:hypothetical protein [Tanacetum cinerariifolium]